MAYQYGDVHCIIIAWWFKLYRHYFKYAYQRNEHDKNAASQCGLFFFTAILGVLSFPVLLSGAILLLFDRNLGTSFYLSDIYVSGTNFTK